MKKLKFIFLFFLLCSFTANSQSEEAKTSIYLEILGNGGLYSINTERKLTSNFYGRIGFGSWSSDGYGEDKIVTFPIMGNMLFGGGPNRLEVGTGILLGWHRYTSIFGG